MKKPPSSESDAEELFKPNLNPQQYGISELFWVIVFVAVVLAFATPFVRGLPPAVFNAIIVVVTFQTIGIALIVGVVSRRRKRLLERSGMLLAVGSSLESQSRAWALAYTLLSIFFSVAMQLYFAIKLSWIISFSLKSNPAGYTVAMYAIMIVSNLLGPTIFLMNSIRFLRWRIHPSAVEFFENGVAMLDTLVTWEKLELRRSTFYPNRMMVLYRQSKSSGMVWMDEAQIDRLLAFADAKRFVKTSGEK